MSNKIIFSLRENKTIKGDIFSIWVDLLYPFTKTTARESSVLASLLRERHRLSQSIKEEDILDSVLFMPETKKQLREELDMTTTIFNNTIALLKKKNIISKNNIIIKKVIPKLDTNKSSFEIKFDISLYERDKA